MSTRGSNTVPRAGWASKTASTAARIRPWSTREFAIRTSVCAPGSMSSSLGSSTKYEYDMTTDSGTPLSEFLNRPGESGDSLI
ncbi:Uncharacterised protein [Mycobacterium tuberculosis]|nr:Uncharacterised protein [Mycobacterium tuberculosis]CPA52159.1 Uncharacterised protein [Mycobacterium tuberculosis]